MFITEAHLAVQAYERECNALRDECRAISEDLEVLVKENQVVNHQLTTVMTERYAADLLPWLGLPC